MSRVIDNISIIGLGRLGLCTALVLDRAGYKVLGVDIFPEYCAQINNKTFNSHEPNVSAYLKESKNLRATTSIDEALAFSQLIIILVDTPTGVAEKSYDHSKLGRVLNQINDRQVKNKHVVIGCTVLPGYIANVGRFLLKDCENTTLSYNPEFIAQGSILRDFVNPDMVLIGQANEEVGNLLENIYRSFCQSKPNFSRMSPESAEITKLAINCFITMKISYSNMIGDIADRTPGAEKFDVLKAVGADSRVGGKCLKPGYGFGGPCFPRDNRALGWYAKSVGVEPLLGLATDQYNKFHANLMIKEMLDQNKELYVFENVAYKDDCPVPIIEESQKLIVAKGLSQAGKKVLIKDRGFIISEVMKEYGNAFQYEITDKK